MSPRPSRSRERLQIVLRRRSALGRPTGRDPRAKTMQAWCPCCTPRRSCCRPRRSIGIGEGRRRWRSLASHQRAGLQMNEVAGYPMRPMFGSSTHLFINLNAEWPSKSQQAVLVDDYRRLATSGIRNGFGRAKLECETLVVTPRKSVRLGAAPAALLGLSSVPRAIPKHRGLRAFAKARRCALKIPVALSDVLILQEPPWSRPASTLRWSGPGSWPSSRLFARHGLSRADYRCRPRRSQPSGTR